MERGEPARRRQRDPWQHDLHLCEHPRQRQRDDCAGGLYLPGERHQSGPSGSCRTGDLHGSSREFRTGHQFHHAFSAQPDLAPQREPALGGDQRFDKPASEALVGGKDSAGGRETGLRAPGPAEYHREQPRDARLSYTFTLRAFDDLHMTTKDVALTVNPAPGAPVISSAASASVIAATPFAYTITASGSPASRSEERRVG